MSGFTATGGPASRTVIDTVVAPVVALAGRLRLGVRLLALAVVMLIPTGVLGQAFLASVGGQIGFAQREREGVLVLQPALAALAQAMTGQPVDLQALSTAVRAHPDLGLDQQLAAVTSAQAQATTAAGRAGWASAMADLITATGNNSNLILDPDLDSFYVMDAQVVQLPSMLVSAAQAAVAPQHKDAAANVADQAVLAGGLSRAVSALTSDLDTAAQHTSLTDLTSRLTSLRQASSAAGALQKTLSATLGAPAAADPQRLAAAAQTAIGPATHALDALLQARITGLSHQRQLTLAATAVSLLLAAWGTLAVVRLTRRDAARTVAAVNALARGDLRAHDLPAGGDEFGDVGRALHTATTTLREAITTIAENAVTLAAASEELSATSTSIAEAADQTTSQAGAVTEATHGVHAHVNSLSAASSQFGASIAEIAQNAAEAARIAATAAEMATRTTETVDQLGRSSAEITDVIQLIQAVAGQTNLLALNATIEAARAGQAGRGFAVVATEVKGLAQQTETATADITNRITQIQTESAAAAAAISEIGTVIAQISEFQTSIAGAVEEQNATASEISHQAAQAASSSAGITEAIAAVTQTARAASGDASDSRTATEELARMSAQLHTLVDQFQV